MIYSVLSNNKDLINNFLKTFSYHNNKYENLIITVDDKTSNWNDMNNIIKSYSDKIRILRLTDIERYSVQTLGLGNYFTFIKVCPIQAKLLIPFYFKWALGIDKFFMMDDDILVNCDIEKLNFDSIDGGGTDDKYGPNRIAPHMLNQFNLCNELLTEKYKFPSPIKDISRIVVCAFFMVVHEDYAEFIFRFFNSTKIYEYIKSRSNNFTVVHGTNKELYPFEEVVLNLYIKSHSKKFCLFGDKLVFQYWGNQPEYTNYKNLDYLKTCLFIHAHLRDTNGSKLHYGDWVISNIFKNRKIDITKDSSIDCPVVYCFDQGFIPFVQKSIESVLRYNPNIEIILCVPTYFEEFKSYKQIVIKDILQKINAFIETERYSPYITKAAYIRLLLPNLLQEYNKVLYLDGDILCSGNLTQLLNTPVEFIGGVPDIAESNIVAKLNMNNLNYSHYINSGMLLMNLENLRKFDFVQKCITYPVEKYPKNVQFFHDQAIINDLLKNNITILPSIYNCQLNYMRKYSIDEYNSLIIQGNKLIHFLGETNTDLFFEINN